MSYRGAREVPMPFQALPALENTSSDHSFYYLGEQIVVEIYSFPRGISGNGCLKGPCYSIVNRYCSWGAGRYGERADEAANTARARVIEVPVLKLEYLKFQHPLFYSSLGAIITGPFFCLRYIVLGGCLAPRHLGRQ